METIEGKQLGDFWDAQAKKLSRILYQKKRPTDFYYQDVVFSMLESWVREIKGRKVLKLDLWNEYTNTNLLSWFKERGAEIYGIDISGEVVKKVKEKINGKFYQGDVLKLPFKSNFFDLVFSLGTIEHTSDPKKAIEENYRILKESGKIIVGVPNKYNLWARPFFVRIAQMMGKYPFGCVRSFSVSELRKMVEDSGFEDIEIKGIVIYPWVIRYFDLQPVSRENGIFTAGIKNSISLFRKFEFKIPAELSEWIIAIGVKRK